MSIRIVLLLGFALVMAGTTAFLARNWLDAQRAALLAGMQQPAEEEDVAAFVLVAVNEMPTGHFVQTDDLAWQAWPEETVVDTYVRKGEGSVENFVGAVVRTPLTIGEPITEARVVRPGDRGFLAAVLDPGLRAVTVKVDAMSGVAGFVFPGDRVDVILTHAIEIYGIHPVKKDKSVTHKASETVLHNVRVLAIDQSTQLEDGQAELAKTATLEVTSKQAEKVKLTARMGSLSLSLRSLASAGQRRKDGNDSAGDRDARPAGFGWRAAEDEGYAFEELPNNGLGRFLRRDGRTYTWDAEVSQLIDPPIPVKSSNIQLLVGRGGESTIMEFSTGRNPFEYFLKDRGQDGNKGFEKLFKDLLKKEDEVAAAYQ